MNLTHATDLHEPSDGVGVHAAAGENLDATVRLPHELPDSLGALAGGGRAA